MLFRSNDTATTEIYTRPNTLSLHDALPISVELWPLDNLLALKIVLNRALQGGAARSLRMDNLGKVVAAQLLRMEIEAPADLPRLRSP